jgi:hypothetical protein
MSLARIGALLLLLSPALCLAQVELSGCRSYEPTIVALHRTLIRKAYAGPPNYSDIRKGDKAETYWLLNLDSPICMSLDASEPKLNPSLKDVRKVQLVLDQESHDNFEGLLGKRIVATGSMFGGHSGHHHTPVLLTVKSLELSH